jgi:hypothetical protein
MLLIKSLTSLAKSVVLFVVVTIRRLTSGNLPGAILVLYK